MPSVNVDMSQGSNMRRCFGIIMFHDVILVDVGTIVQSDQFHRITALAGPRYEILRLLAGCDEKPAERTVLSVTN
jgi:hypothetical protein